MTAAATVGAGSIAGAVRGHTSGSLAALVGAELVGPAHLAIDHLDTIERGGAGAITFIRSASFASLWAGGRATAALVTRGVEVPGHTPADRALLVVDDADLALIKLLELFAGVREPAPAGIHPRATVDPSARIAPDASVGPGCVIGAGTVLGPGVAVAANVTIGRDVRIGRGTVLRPGVIVEDGSIIGERCLIHPGAVIGADGFGFRPSPDGRGVVKVPHIGIVEIGDMVEIGANTCIDRAKFGATVVGSGTKIDNLCQIAHNCRIGRACLICGKSGLAGSVTLGDGVILGGAVIVGDNLSVGSGARVAAHGGVMNDIPAGETWLGLPAMRAAESGRNYAVFRNLSELARTVRKLEKRLEGGADA